MSESKPEMTKRPKKRERLGKFSHHYLFPSSFLCIGSEIELCFTSKKKRKEKIMAELSER